MTLKVTDNDHIQGVKNAPIELIEYADFQCPYCRKANYIVKNLQEKLGSDLKFVFRHFPLAELHANAVHSAIAAEAAGKQGEFWRMHDLLFDNQEYLQDYNLVEYAQQIGLDISHFEADFESDECYRKVQNDYENGLKAGVQGTPTFFINGQRFEGNWMNPEFAEFLESYVE